MSTSMLTSLSSSASSSVAASATVGSSSRWTEPTEMGLVIPCDGIVTNIEYHDQGQYLAVTTNQSAIHFIDSLNGTEKKKLFMKKNGLGKIQFTHNEMCLLVSSKPLSSTAASVPRHSNNSLYNNNNDHSSSASNNNGHDIKYLCVYDNRYLRYFKGHTAEITSLSMNPGNDQFISSAGLGCNSVRLWDLKSPTGIGKISLPEPPNSTHYQPPICNYDSAGLVFGVLTRTALKLYDVRNYSQGPFLNIFPSTTHMSDMLTKQNNSMTEAQILKYLTAKWINFEFSADAGSSVLINTDTEAIFLLDGISADNESKAILTRKNDSGLTLGATFTADAKYIVTGNEDNEILYYDRDTLELKHTLTGHVAPVGQIRCNKVYDTMATGCVNAVLWLQSQSQSVLSKTTSSLRQ